MERWAGRELSRMQIVDGSEDRTAHRWIKGRGAFSEERRTQLLAK